MKAIHVLSVVFLCFPAPSIGQQNRAPRFINFMDRLALPESQPVESSVYKLYAEDDGEVKYYTTSDVFRVDSDTGDVFLIRPLDYESEEKTITIQLEARDEQQVSDWVEPTISVLDANDNPPRFRRRTYKQQIPEDFTVTTDVISNLVVNDVDAPGLAIRVTCEPNVTLDSAQYNDYVEACETFTPRQLRSSNREWLGSIVLLKPLDFETRQAYQIPLVTFDGKNRFVQSFEITLTDVNDTPPKFTYVPETLAIEENQPLEKDVGQVIAVDGDKNIPRPIRYEITQCPSTNSLRKDGSSIFSVGLVSGVITTRTNIDREDPFFTTGILLCIKARELLNNETGELGDDPETSAIASIRVDVLDLNDQTPSFSNTRYNTSIYEDIANGSSIPGVALTVSDLDGYPANSYDIKVINYKDIFKVFPATGFGRNVGGIMVLDTSKIDYERGPRRFELYLRAEENQINGTRPNTGSATVTIHVMDVNDNTPLFSQPIYNASVSETDTGLVPFIKNIRATDPDSGSMGTTGILYSLLGSEFERFQIAPTSIGAAAQMRVTSCSTPGRGECLDYERRRRYDFTVVAEDEYGQPGGRKGTATLEIHITDENDSKPVFLLNSYVGNIREGGTRTVNPLYVTANDLDTVGEVEYSLRPTQEARYWQIDRRSGLITATEPIFYGYTPGERGWFSLTVLANDSVNVAEAPVRINVIDLNNFAPVFEIPNYVTSIPEGTKGDVSVIDVVAVDGDSASSDNGKVEYNIEFGAQGKFVIDIDTGRMSTAPDATFDFDLQRQYLLRVLARDGGNPQQTGTTSVTINIIDENNKAPYFTPQVQFADISESAPIGTWVTTILAKDPDRDANMSFALVEPVKAITPDGVEVDRNVYDYTTLFRVNPTTGEVRVASSLDRDRTSVITYTMIVTDISDSSRVQTGPSGSLIIRIKEFNDQAPSFLQPVYNLTVEEEQAIGTFIAALVAQDADDSIGQYEILERDQTLFAIIPETGVLTVRGRIDYEQVTRTEFTVRATDTGVPPLSGEAKVYVDIININDNSPIPSQNTYTVTIPEHSPGGTSILQISASDRDKGDYGVVRYSLPQDVFQFTIDSVTGEMFLASGVEFDRETEAVIFARVTVYDSPLDPTVRRRYSVPVYVTLEDINDNVPVFSASDYVSAEIIESIDIGAQILQVFATDRDFGINARLRYDKVPESGDPDNLFDVTPFSGQILVAKSLRGRIGTYHFNVSASDLNGGPGHFTGYAGVTIVVIESLNTAPVWFIPPTDNYTVEVLESQYLGMVVFSVFANDSNSGNNGIVEYFLQDAENVVSSTAEFSINHVTGVISAEMVYDREAVDRYTLHLVAKDKGEKPLRAERFLNIIIADVNDNVPEFPMSNGETIPLDITVWENSTIGTVIGSVTAIDRDLPKYSKIYYDIIAGAQGKFSIGDETGAIILVDTLDREEQRVYSLKVRASNGESDDTVIYKRRRRSTDPSIVTVRVTLRDINDEAPRFTGFNGPLKQSPEYYGCISSSAPFDQEIVQLQATDGDEVGPSGLRYSIVSGNTGNAFSIDGLGLVKNRVLLNTLNQRLYTLTAAATDGKWTTTVPVKVFVTEPGNEAKLVINQKESEVELLREKIIRLLQSVDNIRYACVMRVTNHIVGQSAVSSKSDVSVVAVVWMSGGTYRLLSSTELLGIIRQDRASSSIKYDDLYVESVGGVSGGYGFYERTPLLVVLIIIILLLVLTVILLALACYCIRELDRKRRLSDKNTVAFNYSEDDIDKVNPVYGIGSLGERPVDETTAKKPISDIYAVVNKPRKSNNAQTVEPYPFVDEDTGPVIETTVVDSGDLVHQTHPTEVVVRILPGPDDADDDEEKGPVPFIETVVDSGDESLEHPVRIVTSSSPDDESDDLQSPVPVTEIVLDPEYEPSDNAAEVMDVYIVDSKSEPEQEIGFVNPPSPAALETVEELSERGSQHDTITTNPEGDEDRDVRSDDEESRQEGGGHNSPSMSIDTSPQNTPSTSPGPYTYYGDDDV